MIATPRRAPFVIKGWHVLVGFLLFFAIDIGVNAYFMVKAYRTFPGETSATPYEDGVAFNATLRERKAQAALGWNIAAGVDAQGRVRVDASDRSGAPLSGLSVTAHLERPATQTGQQVLTLAASAPGVYEAPGAPTQGVWDLDVTLRESQGHVARADRRLTIP